MNTIIHAIRRRPVRVAEAVIVAFAAAAATWGVDVVDQIETLIAALAAVGVISGEVAQRWTTSLRDPRYGSEPCVDGEDAD